MKLLTVKEAAAASGLSESLIYLWTGTEQRLRHIRVGKAGSRGSIRIRLADLEAFIEEQTVEPAQVPKKRSAVGTFRHIDPRRSGRSRLNASSN